MKSLILICAVGMAFGQILDSTGTGKLRNDKTGSRIYEGSTRAIPSAQVGWDGQKPEPLDVPAIQEKQKNGLANCRGGDDDNLWHCVDSTHLVTTCADKERILEHSESGKYWCRKVQN